MSKYLDESLAALSSEPLGWSDDYDGGVENMWTITLGKASGATPEEVIAYVRRARDIRRDQLVEADGSPVSFYLWSDDLAGELRFSVCRRTPDNLPFGCTVDLVADPEVIVRAYLESPYRDGIPWSELTPVDDGEELDADDDEDEEYRLDVWADVLR
jgi:hypothetical protein